MTRTNGNGKRFPVGHKGSSLQKRIGLIYNRIPQASCPECDLRESGAEAEDVFDPFADESYEIIFDGEAVDEWCSTCGRQTVHVIVWDDDDSETGQLP
jgi:hypothetical protein